MVVPVDLLRRAATDTGGDRDRSAPKLRHARREHRVTASRTKRLTPRPRTQSCHLGFDRVGIAAYPYCIEGSRSECVAWRQATSAPSVGGVVRERGVNGARSAHPRSLASTLVLFARSAFLSRRWVAPCRARAPSIGERSAGDTGGELGGAIASPAVRFMSDNPPPPCGLGDDNAGTLGTMSLDMTPQTQRQRVAQTKCNLCSREIDAQLAERWYWQSDGGPGLFVLCPDCAKNWHHTQR